MKSYALAGALAFGMAASAQAATITIDTFADLQGPVTANAGGSNTSTVATANALGGSRTITVTNTGGPLSTVGVSVAGSYAFSNDALTQGTSTLTYNLGGFDLTDGGLNDTFVAEVTAIDLGMKVTLEIDGESNDILVGGTGDLTYSFAAFTTVDFTNVSTISLTFDSNGVDGVDAVIDLLGARDDEPNPAPVPLPAGGLLLMTGLAGLGYARRRKAA